MHHILTAPRTDRGNGCWYPHATNSIYTYKQIKHIPLLRLRLCHLVSSPNLQPHARPIIDQIRIRLDQRTTPRTSKPFGLCYWPGSPRQRHIHQGLPLQVLLRAPLFQDLCSLRMCVFKLEQGRTYRNRRL